MLSSLLAAIAMAAPQGGAEGQGNWYTSLIPLVVIFAIFYFLMIRPQQKQQKKMREMLSTLKRGDEVVTRGGIMGTIHGLADNIVTLEIAQNVKVKVSREAVVGLQNTAGNNS